MMPLVGFAAYLLTVRQPKRICNCLRRNRAIPAGIAFGLFIRPSNDAAGNTGMIMFSLTAGYIASVQ